MIGGADGEQARPGADGGQARLDKWLWAVRIFKTRAAAKDACSTGRVRVGGSPAKPALRVRVGDVVVVRQGGYSSTYRIERVIEKRVGAVIAADCITDLTPPEDRPKPRSIDQRIDAAWAERTTGTGRPTKRDRRQMEKFLNAPKKRGRR